MVFSPSGIFHLELKTKHYNMTMNSSRSTSLKLPYIYIYMYNEIHMVENLYQLAVNGSQYGGGDSRKPFST